MDHSSEPHVRGPFRDGEDGGGVGGWGPQWIDRACVREHPTSGEAHLSGNPEAFRTNGPTCVVSLNFGAPKMCGGFELEALGFSCKDQGSYHEPDETGFHLDIMSPRTAAASQDQGWKTQCHKQAKNTNTVLQILQILRCRDGHDCFCVVRKGGLLSII